MAHAGHIYKVHFRRDCALDLFRYREAFAWGYHFSGSGRGGKVLTYVHTHDVIITPVDEKTRQPPAWSGVYHIAGVGDVEFRHDIDKLEYSGLDFSVASARLIGHAPFIQWRPLPSGHIRWGELGGRLTRPAGYDPALWEILEGSDVGDLVYLTWAEYNNL